MVEKYLLRIATINFNENISLLKALSTANNCDLPDSGIIVNSKDFFLEIAEELDSPKILTRYNALTKMFFSFIVNSDFQFMLGEKLEDNFNHGLISLAFEYGMIPELVKNLSYFHCKFLEYPKDLVNIKKMILIFFMKINIFLIFLILHLLRLKSETKYYVKYLGDELEEISLRLFKISTTYKYIPCRLLLCLHYTFIKILMSEELDDSELHTCRRVEKKDKFLNRGNLETYLKPEVPLIFFNYEKSNRFIEKFYRKNMLKREKSDLERVVIVSILKILLSTFENNSAQNYCEYIKDFIPEILLKHYLINNQFPTFRQDDNENDNKDLLEIHERAYLDLLLVVPPEEKELYSIIELINKVSITAIIIVFYYNILKTLQMSDLIQYSYFSFHLKDSNGLLVFLKILNQDFKAIEDQFIAIYNKDTINIQFGELNELILFYDLKLIYKICYKNDEYIVKYLVDCKVPIMLKKVLNSCTGNDKIKKYCLKLFKCQLKFYDKNWRMENSNIITGIYLTLKLTSEKDKIDNYLERRDKNSKDYGGDCFSSEELIKIHAEYHDYNYTNFLSNPEEYEKYRNSLQMSLYAKIYLKLSEMAKLPEDYKENYKKYI